MSLINDDVSVTSNVSENCHVSESTCKEVNNITDKILDEEVKTQENCTESPEVVCRDDFPNAENDLKSNSKSEKESENIKTQGESSVTEEDGWLDIIGSGDFKKRVLHPGNGLDTRPKQGNIVTINYTCFDESNTVVEQMSNFELCVGDLDVIQGLDLVIPLMEVGEIAEVLVPSRLAFGKIGRPPSIPPDCKLRYEVEVLEVADLLEENLSPSQILELGNKKRDRGNFWYGRGDYLNSIHCYQRAAVILEGVHDTPENSSEMLQNILDTRIKVHNNMAAAQLKLEAYDQALKSVDFVLRIQPKNVKAHFRKGKILMAKGQTDEALASMKKASELEPDTKIIQQELQRLIQRKKVEEKSQRAMYKRMFPQSASKSKSSNKWVRPWSIMAGSCLALAIGVAAYRQYFT